jgi:hypothetical protein
MVAFCRETRKLALGMAPSKCRLLHCISDEVVELHSGIRLVQWRKHHRQHLQKLKISATHRERKDILARLERMSLRQTINVGRVIEEAFALHLHETWVVLSRVLEALPFGSGGQRFPICRRNLAEAIHSNRNTTIEDGDEMSIGNQVQDVPP